MAITTINTQNIENNIDRINQLCVFTVEANTKFPPSHHFPGDVLIAGTSKVNNLFESLLKDELSSLSKQINDYKSNRPVNERPSPLDKKISEFESNISLVRQIIIKRNGGFLYVEQRQKSIRVIGLPNVSACFCCDRMKRTERQSFPSFMEYFLPESFKTTTKKIKICSIGYGNCLQELMTHTYFLSKNKKIDWVLVDSAVEMGSDVHEASVQFKKLIQFISPECEVEWVCAPSAAMPGNTYYEQLLSNNDPDSVSKIPDIFLKVDADFDGSPRPYIERRLTELSSEENPKMFAEFSSKTPQGKLDIKVFKGKPSS